MLNSQPILINKIIKNRLHLLKNQVQMIQINLVEEFNSFNLGKSLFNSHYKLNKERLLH
jgi:hypothetical protein